MDYWESLTPEQKEYRLVNRNFGVKEFIEWDTENTQDSKLSNKR